MDPAKDMPGESDCTTCQFLEDSSNYWTAVLFFRARNGTYKRVPIVPNVGFEGAEGGMTVYYMQNGLADYQQTSKVTAFKPGFRMIIGDPLTHTAADANRFRQVTYTCLQTRVLASPRPRICLLSRALLAVSGSRPSLPFRRLLELENSFLGQILALIRFHGCYTLMIAFK